MFELNKIHFYIKVNESDISHHRFVFLYNILMLYFLILKVKKCEIKITYI